MDKLNVNIGDKIIVTDRWNVRFISTVEKITPKGNIRVDGILYGEEREHP